MFSKNAEFPPCARANAPCARGIGDRLRAGAQPEKTAVRIRRHTAAAASYQRLLGAELCPPKIQSSRS